MDHSSEEFVYMDDHQVSCELRSVDAIIVEATTEDDGHRDNSTVMMMTKMLASKGMAPAVVIGAEQCWQCFLGIGHSSGLCRKCSIE